MAVELKHLAPESLKPAAYNPRKIGEVERAALARGIAEFGMIDPIVCRAEDLLVLGGHQRLSVAVEMGLETVPVALVPGLSDDRAAALNILLNNPRAQGAWDMKALSDILSELDGHGFDATLTGFSDGELEGLLTWTPDPGEPVEEGDVDLTPPKEPESKLGEVYDLGRHRLMCGDCRNATDVAKLLDGARVNLAFTSPPYAEQRVYDQSSEFKPIPPDEYVEWFRDVAANVKAALAPDGSWFVNIKPPADGLDTHLYVMDLAIAHVRQWGWHFATEFCWERNGVPKGVTQRFKNQFEPIYQFVLGRWKMRPEQVQYESANVPKARGKGAGNTSRANAQGGNGAMFGGDRKRRHGVSSGAGEEVQGTNWQPGEYIGPGMAYPGNRLPTFTSSHEATGHTAAFPVGLPEFFVNAYTDRGDVIYDPFAGSGSTLIASERTGRRGLGMEISPRYCDVIRRRYEAYISQNAVAA